MSIVDNLIAARILALINMPFTRWRAYELGLIDDEGNTLKRATTSSERGAWSYLHRIIRKVKRLMDRVPGARIAASLYSLRESVNIDQYRLIEEGMVAGATVNALAGTTTGGTTREPGGFDNKKKRKKKDDPKKLDESSNGFNQLVKELEQLVKRRAMVSRRDLEVLVDRFSTVTRSSDVTERELVYAEELFNKLRNS